MSEAQAKRAGNRASGGSGASRGSSPHRDMPPPAKITLLYESRDKKLCLFEDADGHLTAVRSERLV